MTVEVSAAHERTSADAQALAEIEEASAEDDRWSSIRPNGRKPVYCKDCFARNEGGGESGSRPARDFNLTPKPFVKSPSPMGGDKRIDDMKVQLDSVNYKLEKLIKMLEGSKAETPKPVVVAKAEAPVSKAVKPAAKKAAPKKK
jgi:hypothetical protein